ncbi:MAG TPA: rhodanese-like domain-containing protein [Armatimonadota bacterium]
MAKEDRAVQEIARDEFVHKWHSGEPFILIDVLPHEHFLRVHLPRAINVPVNLLHDLAPLLFGQHDQLVVYCSNSACQASATAAKILMLLGYDNVLDYAGGILDWEEGGLPVIREAVQQERAA